MPSPVLVFTLPGEDTQTHSGVTQLDEWAGAFRQPQPCQQDVPATHISMNQALVFLGRSGKGPWPLGDCKPRPNPGSHRDSPCEKDTHSHSWDPDTLSS